MKRNKLAILKQALAIVWIVYICLYYFNRTTNIFVLIRDYFHLPI